MRAYDLTVSGSLDVTGSIISVTNITSSGDLEIAGNITGSSTTTGSFGKLVGEGGAITGVTAEWDGTHTGNGVITGNFDVSGNISGSLTSTASLARIEALTISASTVDVDASTLRIGGEVFNKTLLTNIRRSHSPDTVSPSGKLSLRGNISGSVSSTGSFGRVEASTLKGTLTTAAQSNVTSVGTIGTGIWNSTFGATANTLISGSANAANISGSFTSTSSSLASRVTTNESYVKGKEVLSGSAQIATVISGSLGTNATLIRSLTAVVISGSANAANISGSFTTTSSSLASKVTTLEGTGTAQGVGTTNSPTFADITATGTVTAQDFTQSL